MPILMSLPRLAVRAGPAAAAALLAALAGCASTPGPATRQVASLPSATSATTQSSGSQPTGAGSGPAGLQGPTIPNDASKAQYMRLTQPWDQCLQQHGVAHLPGTVGSNLEPHTLKTAETACQSLQPHPPWQQMPAYNPRYRQDLAAWVNCLNGHGIHVHVIPGGWTFDSSAPLPPDERQVELSCEAKAFHEGPGGQ